MNITFKIMKITRKNSNDLDYAYNYHFDDSAHFLVHSFHSNVQKFFFFSFCQICFLFPLALFVS